MHPYKLETENGIEYVVIELLGEDEIQSWKKIVNENFKFLKNPNFKFVFNIFPFIVFYTNKYKFHNINGPAFSSPSILSYKDTSFYINNIKYESEEEYINEVRRIILNEINNGDEIEL